MAKGYLLTQDEDVQHIARLAIAELTKNPLLSVARLQDELGLAERGKLWKALAAAALDGLYTSIYDSDPDEQVKDRRTKNRLLLVTLMDTGDVNEATKAIGRGDVKGAPAHNMCDRLVRHYAWKRAQEVERAKAVSLREAKVSDKLTDIVLNELDFEEDMAQGMQVARAELARSLYEKAKTLWERVMVFAQVDEVDRHTANMIRALTEAATTAIKDAQLLSGKATDRVEGLVRGLNSMSNEELYAFVREDVVIRDLTERGLALPEKELSDKEVLDAEYRVSE